MKVLPPITISDAMLIDSTLPEADFPAWVPGSTYAAGERRIHAGTHSVYERLVAGAGSLAPPDDPANWERVGPTNRWAAFDGARGTLSQSTGSMSFTVAPGLVSGLALLDVTANSVTVEVRVGAELVYSRTVSLNTGLGVFDAYTYCFSPIIMRRTLVLDDLPPFSAGHITVTLNSDGPVSVGVAAFGSAIDLGDTLYNGTLGFTDYSVKETDKWGTTTLTKRKNARRATLPFVTDVWRVDYVMERLSDLQGVASVWIGASRNDSTIFLGWPSDAQVSIKYALKWECSVTINGLI